MLGGWFMDGVVGVVVRVVIVGFFLGTRCLSVFGRGPPDM